MSAAAVTLILLYVMVAVFILNANVAIEDRSRRPPWVSIVSVAVFWLPLTLAAVVAIALDAAAARGRGP